MRRPAPKSKKAPLTADQQIARMLESGTMVFKPDYGEPGDPEVGETWDYTFEWIDPDPSLNLDLHADKNDEDIEIENHSGQRVTIVEKLWEDWFPMYTYKVRFSDGFEVEAFRNELARPLS